jgi:hypothetical protein
MWKVKICEKYEQEKFFAAVFVVVMLLHPLF